MPREYAPSRRAEGYTLIEVLVTLAIVALLGSLLLPRMSKPPALQEPEIVKFFTVLRAEAVRTGQPVSVELSGRILRVATLKREHRLAEGEAFRKLIPSEITYLGGYHVVTFFPDGSSTSAEWVFTREDGSSVAIRFSPFASRIAVSPVRQN